MKKVSRNAVLSAALGVAMVASVASAAEVKSAHTANGDRVAVRKVTSIEALPPARSLPAPKRKPFTFFDLFGATSSACGGYDSEPCATTASAERKIIKFRRLDGSLPPMFGAFH